MRVVVEAYAEDSLPLSTPQISCQGGPSSSLPMPATAMDLGLQEHGAVDCKFVHGCRRCGGPHTVLDCPNSQRQFDQAGKPAPGPMRHDYGARGSGAGKPY